MKVENELPKWSDCAMKASKSRKPSRAVRSHAGFGELTAALTHAHRERGWADFYDFDDDVKRWDAEIARLKASIEEREDGAERPRRVQLRRTKDWRLPPNTIVVSRPSKWGNPFKVTPERSQISAVGAFRIWLTTEGVTAGIQERKQWMLDHMPELRGKNLACWCALNSACHADVLLSLVGAWEETANGTKDKTQNAAFSDGDGGLSK